MKRREFLPSLALLAAPKLKISDLNTCRSAINLSYLISSLNRTITFEMSEVQHMAWTMLKAECGLDKGDSFTAGMCHTLPISINKNVPKDEIWLIAFDGTVISKIINLAIPTGF